MKRLLFSAILLLSCLTALAPTVQVTGSGTVNAYPFWRNASSITTTSALYQANGFIGVNTTNPVTELMVSSITALEPRGFSSSQFSSTTNAARINLRKARGTEAVPTIVVTGDRLGGVRGWGYDGSAFLDMAGIDILITGTVAANRVPTQLEFYTATDAAPSVKTTRMTITPAGLVTINGTGLTLTAGDFTVASGSTYITTSRGRIEWSGDGQLLFRNNAATGFSSLQLGPDNATPANASLKTGNGSGTDKAGGNMQMLPGLSTGAGTSGTFSVWTGGKSSTGSTLNTATNRFEILALGEITFPSTVTAAGTTATQTINKPSGRINIAAAGTTATVNNSLVTTNSLVFATIASNDTTATLKNVVSGTGSFVITLTAAANAETKVNFWVINQ